MNLSQLIPAILLFGSTAVSLTLAHYTWQRRPAMGAKRFTVLLLATAVWCFAYGLELLVPGLAGKVALTKVQYLGIVAFPIAWFTFVMAHTGRGHWFNGRTLIWLGLIPATTLLLVLTNEAHGLIWQSFGLNSSGPLTLLAVEYGPWFWVHTLYSYLLILGAYYLLIVNWRREIVSLYRWQALPLLISIMILPWLGNLVYVFGLSPVDLTPFTFLIAGLILGQYILRFRVFDITPLAQTAILDSIDEPLLAVDENGRLIYYNEAARPLLARERSELIGQPLATIWPALANHPPDAPRVTVTPPAQQNGQARQYEVHTAPLYDSQHRDGQLLTLHDVTERQQLDELRDHLTHTMVHDLRAPITNTLIALEMLRTQIPDTDLHKREQLLDMTTSSAQQTLDLVNQILDVGRLEAGQLPIHPRPVDLKALISTAVTTFQPRIQRRNLTLINTVPDDLPAVFADEALLQRVIQNLLDNSIKFSPANGSVQIHATLTAVVRQGPGITIGPPKVIVTITDSGPGIPDALQDHIFDKYATAASDFNASSGLGLAFCRMALNTHNEEIWLENHPGKGATFAFSLSTATVPTTA